MKQSLNISPTKSLLKASMERLLKAYELASKFGIKIFDEKFDVSCPAIENPLNTVKVKISWVIAEPDTVEAHLFTQFEKALSALEYAKHIAEDGTYMGGNYDENKRLYTELNVYGRAMFINIVKQMEYSRKPSIFTDLANYPEEGLDFNTYGYDQSTKVAEIYKAHIAPTINPWVESLINTLMEKLVQYLKVEDKVEVSEKVEVLNQIDINLIQGNDDVEISGELPSSQTVVLAATDALPETYQ